ncbi:MAG: ABC transporter substrate-binding protein [Bacillota bacterium]|nr:ABC transporter substrate-binding protein [Bacillota bacterium]
MKKRTSILVVIMLMLAMLTSCMGEKQGTEVTTTTSVAVSSSETQTTSETSKEASKYPYQFVDSLGREFVLEQPLEKVIVLNRQTAEAFKILDIDDKVIAVGDTVHKNNSYLGYNDLPDMGKIKELNVESIIDMKPDAVFVHTNRAMELEDVLTPAGIKVIRIDNYQPEKYEEELMLLAEIFDKTERAKEFLAYRKNMEADLQERVSKVAEDARPKIMALSAGFLNSKGGYRIFPCYSNDGTMGVGEGYSTILLGAKDASPEIVYDKAEASTTVMVDEEYALSCNPDVITLHGTWLGGYEAADEAEFDKVVENIYQISSIGKMKAGQEKKVYIFHTDFLGASKRHIGLMQLGKYLYPEQFADVDVEVFAKEYFEKWLGAEFKGIWYYEVKK